MRNHDSAALSGAAASMTRKRTGVSDFIADRIDGRRVVPFGWMVGD
jgi:hypothetical protein